MNIAHLLQNSVINFPERPAVSTGCKSQLNYAELGMRTECLASSLRELSVGSQHVVITLPNCAEYIEILFGT